MSTLKWMRRAPRWMPRVLQCIRLEKLKVVQQRDSWRLEIRVLFGLSSRKVSTALARLGPRFLDGQASSEGSDGLQNDRKLWNGLEWLQTAGGFQ